MVKCSFCNMENEELVEPGFDLNYWRRRDVSKVMLCEECIDALMKIGEHLSAKRENDRNNHRDSKFAKFMKKVFGEYGERFVCKHQFDVAAKLYYEFITARRDGYDRIEPYIKNM